jgi:hypothetical protein
LAAREGVHDVVNDPDGFGAPSQLLDVRYPASNDDERYAKVQNKDDFHLVHQDKNHSAMRFGTRLTSMGAGSAAGSLGFMIDREYGGEFMLPHSGVQLVSIDEKVVSC